MPLPGEHSCRIRNPADFQKDSFRRTKQTSDGKTLWLIVGRLKGAVKTTLQAFRYPKGTWTAAQARSHCEKQDGSFTAAGETDSMPDVTKNSAITNEASERRFLNDCEMRVLESEGDSSSPGTLTGYAAVFDSLSEKLGSFYERIAKGAFAESLKRGDDVRAFIEHEGGLSTLGRTTAGTLKLKEDSHGLHSMILLPNTQAARNVSELVKSGNLNQMSFGFRVPKGGDDWIDGKDGEADVRVLKQIDLIDVSVVAVPAYPATDVKVATRSRVAWLEGRTTRVAKVESRWKEIHLTEAKKRIRLGR